MMEYIIYIYWCMFVIINVTTGKPDYPTDVQVNVTGDDAHITWKIRPTVISTRIDGPNIPTAEKYDDIRSPTTSYVMEGILQYKTTIGMMVYSPTGWSDQITITFWKTDTNVYSKRGSNVSLTFKSDSEIYTLLSPTDATLFSITFGSIVNNTGDDRFIANKTSDGLSLSLSNIQPTDAGGYRLEEDQQVLVITEKPKTPELTSDKVGFDGEELHLTCESSVQRWPTYLPSSLQYKFSTEGEKHGNKLSINITRQDKGKQIYCQATDDRGDVSNNSNIFTLDPYYGPDNPVLTYAHNQLNITEGSDMTAINCSADCYPQCSYEWKWKVSGHFDTQFHVHSQTLKINNITRQNSGKYRCVVKHQNDTSRKSHNAIEINVQYPPDIRSVRFSKNSGAYQEYTNSYILDEGDQIEVKTYIDSNPEPSIRFNTSQYNQLSFSVNNKWYTARLPSLRCEDSGNHYIVADNGIKDSSKKIVKFDISCSPKYVKVSQDEIGTKIGDTVNITVHGVAFPKPTITWTRKNVVQVNDGKDNKDFTFNISYGIHIHREADFGVYNATIKNKLNSSVVTIRVIAQDKPQAPTNVTVVDISHFYVNVSWIANFDGGKPQTFSIKYKAKSSNSWTTKKLDRYGNPKKGDLQYHRLVDLQPSTLYLLEVIAKNELGESCSSTNFKTSGLPILTTSAEKRTLIIGAIAGSLVSVLFLIAIFIIVRRRRGINNGLVAKDKKVTFKTADKKTNRQDKAPSLVDADDDNTTEYAVVDKTNRRKVDSEDVNTTEYAVVDKSNRRKENVVTGSHVEYAAVDKINKQKAYPVDVDNSEYAVVDKTSRKKAHFNKPVRKYLHFSMDVSLPKLWNLNAETCVVRSKIGHDDDDVTVNDKTELLVKHKQGRYKNQDGLTYVEVSFSGKPSKSRRPVIHGAENRTEYVQIDFTKKAKPQPDEPN